jgi:spermidine synthase
VALLSLGAAEGPRYTVTSAAFLLLALLPFCAAMGATFPTALAFVKRAAASEPRAFAFSYLYVANVGGALLGVLVTSFVLIEAIGFAGASRVGVALNVAVALLAYAAGRGAEPGARAGDVHAASAPESSPAARVPAAWGGARLGALFLTGFTSMGLEVVWTRIYPPYVGTFVYSFAGILATYLIATTAGSLLYRRRLLGRPGASPWRFWHAICLAAMLPIASASIDLHVGGPFRIALGLAPFCLLLGLFTPWVLDEQAGNDPARVGRAYAVNLLGCLLGPLVTGFLLLPAAGPKTTSLLLVAPLFLFAIAAPVRRQRRFVEQAAALALAAAAWLGSRMFEEQFARAEVRHDHTATVVATGEGFGKRLLVNGVGMTVLTPITKMMVHFPLAHLEPQGRSINGLVICLGMGTSLRSLASWGGRATAVELVPSVARLFPYYYADAPALLASPGGRVRVVVDDGRRFLDRSDESFDFIAVDPPPPVEAAGSSLLYSKEFYASVRRRLAPGGILQAWFPGGDGETQASVTRAILESFPYVRAFISISDWGVHYLASERPIPPASPEEMLARMPEAAARDLAEWGSAPPIDYLRGMLAREIDPRRLAARSQPEGGIALTDDRPVNEFFFLRRHLARGGAPKEAAR